MHSAGSISKDGIRSCEGAVFYIGINSSVLVVNNGVIIRTAQIIYFDTVCSSAASADLTIIIVGRRTVK
ncbi:MAG: hypothetical protein WDO16_05350 [Bacteroidota bacterium]